MKYLRHGCELTYALAPDKQFELPLVLGHGMWMDATVYDKFVSLANLEGWNVVTITLPAHFGDNGIPLGRISVQYYAESVKKVVEEIGEHILIGHSMFGLIGQKVAESNLRVRGLGLLASAAPKGIFALNWPLIKRVLASGYWLSMVKKTALSLTERDAGEFIFNKMGPLEREVYISRLRPESGLAARECALSLVSVDESKVTCPVLAMSGKDDLMSPPEEQQKIAYKFGTKLVKLEGGHMLMTEQSSWYDCAKNVFRWARSISPQVREPVAA